MEDRPFSDNSFQQFLNEEKLMGSRCKICGELFVPPRPLCPKCNNTKMEWVPIKGNGKLAAFTSIFVGPPYMVKEGYDRKHPYIAGVVELEEGPKVDARIEGIDATKPELIKIGTPLTATYLHRGEGAGKKTFLAFKPG